MTSDPIDSADFGIPWSRSGFYLELKTPELWKKQANDSTNEKSYLLKQNVLQKYNL